MGVRKGRWASREENETRVVNGLLKLRRDPGAGLAELKALAAEAGRHDRGDAALLQRIVETHEYLAG